MGYSPWDRKGSDTIERLGTQTEFYHDVCTEVDLGIGVDPTHAHIRIFFVPSLRGHPVELLGWVEWGNLWGSVHRRTLFPRDVVSLSVRRQGMRSDLSESAHSFLSCRKNAFDPSGATVL